VMGEQLSIPEILQVPQIARGESQVPLDCLPGAFVQSPRASRPLGFPQCAQTLGFEASHPTFDRRWMLPQPLGDLIATVALGNEQNTVQPVVVAGLFRAIDLVLQSESHDGGVGDSELSHAQLYRGHATSARYYAALLLTLCIVLPIMVTVAGLSGLVGWPLFVLFGWRVRPATVAKFTGGSVLLFIIAATPFRAAYGWPGSYFVCILALLVCAVWFRENSELSAPPNGGPAPLVGNSGVTEEPPSVS